MFGPGTMLLIAVGLTLAVKGKLAEASSTDKAKDMFREPCQSFKDCGTDTMLTCVNNVCQCARFQYYEASMSRCVSPVNEICDVSQESKDGLPLLKCGELARCLRVRNERQGKCHCRTHNVRSSLDPKRCVPEPPTTEAPHAPPDQIPGSTKKPPSFPGFNEETQVLKGTNAISSSNGLAFNLLLLCSTIMFCMSVLVL